MNARDLQSEFRGQAFHVLILIVGMGLLSLGSAVAVAQEATPAQSQETTATEEESPTLPSDQLDSLVAPIALYADSLLAQTLAASTYPL